MKRNFKLPPPLIIELDPDVQAVLAFMHANFEATKLVDIANAVKELSGPLFGRFKTEPNVHKLLGERFIPIAFKPPSYDKDN